MSTPTPNRPNPPLRVFVVENHDDSRLMLTMLLSSMGHQVKSAASMHEALDALPQADPEVLVSDIGLPDGDGWELLKRVHLPHEVYAIAMSGYGMASDRARSLEAGFRHHLVKPMDIEQLEHLLAEASRELGKRSD
ncbi:response regulator [Piscinibacter sp. HJYY11]|uniref:response regulator n=1 Tax=Piscinibacter sp. HJYY11 TaxID=2801333 RepID=UPI00191D0ED1|nr:response regulator [Piscinibacter sp. HJYY11]MBL0727192.1 response regulator [Piscinibacter sp. HJYY11]